MTTRLTVSAAFSAHCVFRDSRVLMPKVVHYRRLSLAQAGPSNSRCDAGASTASCAYLSPVAPLQRFAV